MDATRRELVAGGGALLLTGCVRPPDWCGEPERIDDGDADSCTPTASAIEGPFYARDAPWREDLTRFGDEGDEIVLSGVVAEGACGVPVPGAVIEVWHADPDGRYDNRSDEMRYRGRVRCDAEGRWSLRTLLPGRYRNGDTLRPAHLHVKIVVDEVERLTTQLYFAGDPYLECDPLVSTSLVLALEQAGAVQRATFDFLLS
jgi:protocatechuate 3,4-dioxygenase beta subunit